MKENKGLVASLAALLPALVLAATGWMEAKSATAKKYDALDSYREYIEDRMARDAALERALQNCMALLPAVAVPAEEPPEGMSPEEERVFRGLQGASTLAQRDPVDLDELAEEFGYEQKVAPE